MADDKKTGREQTARPEPRKKRPGKRRRRRSAGAVVSFALLYVAAVISISILLACVGWICANDVLALNKQEKSVTFQISKDETFDHIVDRLKDEGLIEYKFLFRLFSSVTHGEEKIIPGTYTLNTNMDYRALISGMSINSATKQEISVTIPEGYTVEQIFELLEERGVSTVEELNDVAANHDYAFSFLQDIPLGDPKRLEGYLFPSTYNFYTPHSALYVINKMLVAFDSNLTEDMRQSILDGEHTIHEIITIASLIERESDGTDRSHISSVIYNRLNNPEKETAGFLQIDATLVYINGGREPTAADQNIDSPYNTYQNKGLPPGPIANPGIESIKAAMNPDNTRDYYYALGDDDVHHFFRTYNSLQNFLKSQQRYS